MNKLTEAFSPTMPKWLREVLTTSPKAEYNMKDLLKNLHIDLSKATFIEYPLPKSNRDPIKTADDKIVFYHVQTPANSNYMVTGGKRLIDTVLVNDDYFIGDAFWSPELNQVLPFGQVGWGKLFNSTKDICYIDKNDPNNFISADKRDQRRETKSTRIDTSRDTDITDYNGGITNAFKKELGYRRFTPAEQQSIIQGSDRYVKRYSGTGLEFDKSGYLKNPKRVDDLINRHPEVRSNKIIRNIDKLYDDIVLAQNDFATFVSNSTSNLRRRGDSKSSSSSINNVTYIADKLKQAVSYYNEALDYIEQALDSGSTNDPTDTYWQKRANTFIENANEILKSLDSALDTARGYIVDWDTDDMYIDDDN